MAVEDAIVALPEHWDDVMSRLGTAGAQELRTLVEGLGGPDHRRVVSRIADLLAEGLPPEHAVRRELAEGYLLSKPPNPDWSAVTLAVRAKALRLPDSGPQPVGRVLTDYWDDIWTSLDGARREELGILMRELILLAADEDAAGQLVPQVVQIIRQALPAEHPARGELERGTRLAVGAQPGWGRLTGQLRMLSARITWEQVRARLLQAAAWSPAQVRARGEDPGRRFLIRLDTPASGQRIPAFQFDLTGHAIPLVLEVNEHLSADEDPWGAADWWLGRNTWLEATPADLIGRDDPSLRAAAAGVGTADW